ncbi:MAG: hypothetical protein K6F05_09335 [Succinivibrio sp.]|nr:hypothetical protein [Succinivibrio sp.]
MSDLSGVRNSNLGSSNVNFTSPQQKRIDSGAFSGLDFDAAELEDSMLEDAAEEMSFSKDNSKQTKLEHRKQRNADLRLEDRLKKLRENLTNRIQSKEQSDALSNEATRRECTADDLIKRLKEYGGHCAEDYALLMDMAEKEQDTRKAGLFREAANKLYAENQGAIDAVLNALNVESGQFVGQFNAVENAENYSNAIINFSDSYDMLNYIIDKYKDDAEAGLEFMTQALGADLEAAHKSHEPEYLMGVAQGLSQAKVLYSGYKHEETLLDRLSSQYDLDVSGVNKLTFLKGVGNLTKSAFVSPMEVRDLLSAVATANPEQEVQVCQELSKALHNMADVMFGTLDTRIKINDACARMIDQAIEAEDAWLEKQ